MHALAESTLPCPFQVRTAGTVERSPQHFSRGTKQGDIMLYLVEAGAGNYEYNGRRRCLQAGEIGLIVPEKNGIIVADQERPYRLHWCRFNGAYAHSVARSIIAERGDDFFTDACFPTLCEVHRRLVPVQHRHLPTHMGHNEVILADLLRQLHEATFGQPGRDAPRGLKDLPDYLNGCVDQPTDLDRIAREFGVAKSTLCRRAKQLFGQTVLQLHERAKITWACELLASPHRSVKEVAFLLGYASPFYFSRVFKKHLGMSPQRWRAGGVRGEPS